MGTFVRDSASKLFTVGLTNVIVDIQKMWNPIYQQIFSVKSSTKKDETDFSMYGILSIPQVGENENFDIEDVNTGYEKVYTHLKYGLILRYSREAKDDELYGFVNRMPGFLTKAMQYTVEASGANVLDTLDSTTGADGVYLLATNHPSLDGTRANKPTVDADLGYTTLENARLAILARKSWEGHPIITPDKLRLVVPTALEPMARKLLLTDGQPFSADNTINYLKGMFEPLIHPFMTDSNRWLLIPKPSGYGFVWYWRDKPSMKEWVDDNNDSTSIRNRARWSNGVTQWEEAVPYGSVGA